MLPAQAALQAFADRPVALLVGGHDRGLDYATAWPDDRGAHRADARRHHAGQRAAHRPRPYATATGGRVEVRDASDLDAAVDMAFEWAPAGRVVLLSPAAPSFGRFGDYRERAAAFASAAARLGTLS